MTHHSTLRANEMLKRDIKREWERYESMRAKSEQVIQGYARADRCKPYRPTRTDYLLLVAALALLLAFGGR